MADKKISELTALTTSNDAVEFVINDGGASKKITRATLFTGDGGSLTGIDALPTQTGHSGKYLTTDATNASWATLDTDSNATTKGLYEMANTIGTVGTPVTYVIGTGNNAISASPITIETGSSVTIPTGSTWVLA